MKRNAQRVKQAKDRQETVGRRQKKQRDSPQRIRESSNRQLASLCVAESTESVKATEDVGVALLLVPLALVGGEPAFAALGQARRDLPARGILCGQNAKDDGFDKDQDGCASFVYT